MEDLISEAIENQKIIEFDYDGYSRTVEPHCLGVSTAGNTVLRAYQVDGFSSSGRMGWKLYDLNNADGLEILTETFNGPRDGYNPDDKAMDEIICAL
ncbi:WYL domain-containing protein [Flagellimonas profundi]|uniref:WYL domain-containing protein n=1 Tax=Flagellimonas profundi TaxID=2915620 RepID=A0ABS3FCW9_9FLAO|nr:WYL domain-containing protein [Allomuricauda profundi]MBO0341014.1 WYL domain-containing protein [Allomuricauda profundi]